jgi:hypothetical protein
MAAWHLLAIERLGTPDPAWTTLWGPAQPGSDPVAANRLRTLDLTPSLKPIKSLTQTLERDLTKSSMGSLSMDLADPDGSLSEQLGPFSNQLATATRYYGPWIQLTEVWPGGQAIRFLGFLDETSIEWDEATGLTRCTALHASQLLRERLLTDVPGILRPFPTTPATQDKTFIATTGDALMAAAFPPSWTPTEWSTPFSGIPFSIRANAADLESARWAVGRLSWSAFSYQQTFFDPPSYGEYGGAHEFNMVLPGVKDLPAPRVRIGSQVFNVSKVVADTDPWLSAVEWQEPADAQNFVASTGIACNLMLELQGAPDLRPLLSLGTSVAFAQTELERNHYLLLQPVSAPANGSDGQKWLKLDTVDQLVAGDDLVIHFTDASNGKPREGKLTVKVIDLDGERNIAHLKDPLTQALPTQVKIRRDSQDPVHVDGVQLATKAVAPFTLDTSQLLPATTARPVLSWLPHAISNPSLYGVTDLQPLDWNGTLRVSRRGAGPGATDSPLAGVWEGMFSQGLVWKGLDPATRYGRPANDPAFPLAVVWNATQWPEPPAGAVSIPSPILYIQGDLSAGATIPPNGWYHPHRSYGMLTQQRQPLPFRWTGTALLWDDPQPTADLAPVLMHATGSTGGRAAGRWTVTGNAWTFQAFDGNGGYSPTIEPISWRLAPVNGSWLSIGVGISGSTEGILGLYVTGSAFPWTKVQGVLLQPSRVTNTAVASPILFDASAPGAPPAGPWALGGGLVVNTYTETFDSVDYPHSRLYLIDGRSSGPVTLDLPTLEVLPGTIQPLSLTGDGAARRVSGWYALALETYTGEDFVPHRRARFLWLDANLRVLNGDPEPDPRNLDDRTLDFRRGEVIAEAVPDGSLPAKMIRLYATPAASPWPSNDTMVGFLGGRLFQVDRTIPRTLERVRLDGLSVSDFMDHLGIALMASPIATPQGGLNLVSRRAGTFRERVLEVSEGGPQYGSVSPDERSSLRVHQASRAFVSEVRLRYEDSLTGDNQELILPALHQGGKPMNLELGRIIGGMTAARSIGEAVVSFFGQPTPSRIEVWKDRTPGFASSLPPAFWASWSVGDVVTLQSFAHPTLVEAWKIHRLESKPEDRTCAVELLRMIDPISVGVAV